MRHCPRKEQMFAALGHFVLFEGTSGTGNSSFEFKDRDLVLENIKYIMAVEDFDVFSTFMEDVNIMMNDETSKELESLKRFKGDSKRNK
jgi:hypothetical protein